MKRILIYIFFLLPICTFAQTNTPFRFVHIANRYYSGTADAPTEYLKQFAAILISLNPMPAFVVNTGEITKSGLPEEFAGFMESVSLLKMPFYSAAGSNDVSLNASGKETFKQIFKQLYRSFDFNGCHFVVLDTTIPLSAYGHIDLAELKWLVTDLKKMKKETPVFFFMHHGVNSYTDSVDNGEAFLRLIAPYNVIALFGGGGASRVPQKVNGIICINAPSLDEGGYNLIEADTTDFKISRVTVNNGGKEPELLATIPRVSPPYRHAEFLWGDPNIPLLERRRPLVQLEIGKNGAHDDRVTATYRIDDSPRLSMTRDVRDRDSASFLAEFATRELIAGTHVLNIEMTDLDKQVYRRIEPFLVERLSGSPKRLWDEPYKATESIQASPVLAGDLLIFGALDGMITALDTKNGHKRWSTPTKGGIIATPLVVDNTVYVASTDHFLYALESQTGRVRWKHDCCAPLFSTPAIGDGVVCIGGDHKIIGLDSETGTEKWSYLTGGLFHNRAVFAADHFYLNGSDNTLYALSSNGKLKWKQTVGTKNYGDERFGPIYSPADDSPTYLNGRIYINTNDNALLALRSDTGELVWKSGYPFADGFIKGFSSPIAQDGVIFVHEREGSPNVFAIEPSTGELRWTANTHVQLNSNIIDLSGDHLTVCSTTGQISWIDRKSGKLLYQYWLDPGSVFSAPVSSGKVTYAASMNGMVYAIAIP